MELNSIKFYKAILAGLLGTVAMTIVAMWVAPMMGMPPMNPAGMLAKAMGNNEIFGWIGHFMMGTILALIYAAIQKCLPGPSAIRGALYSIAPWLLAQIVVVPMMGMPFFMGSMKMAIGSLIGHLVYGVVLGSVYGESEQKDKCSSCKS